MVLLVPTLYVSTLVVLPSEKKLDGCDSSQRGRRSHPSATQPQGTTGL